MSELRQKPILEMSALTRLRSRSPTSRCGYESIAIEGEWMPVLKLARRNPSNLLNEIISFGEETIFCDFASYSDANLEPTIHEGKKIYFMRKKIRPTRYIALYFDENDICRFAGAKKDRIEYMSSFNKNELRDFFHK